MHQRLKQTKEFWHDLFRGPERAITPIEDQKYYNELIHDIHLWLWDIFSISPDLWNLTYCSKNPHSEIFIFFQNVNPIIPQKIFIKRYITQLKGENSINNAELQREVGILSKLRELSGQNLNIHSPTLLAVNIKKSLIAVVFEPGVSFFNILFKSPLTTLVNSDKTRQNSQVLSALGNWLRNMHDNFPIEYHSASTISEILNSIGADINSRIDHLKDSRPADFPPQLCDRILTITENSLKRISSDSPKIATIHGDFTLANILYDAGHLCILDFANTTPGYPEDDLARMYLDLYNIQKWSFSFCLQEQNTYISAFINGYGNTICLDYDYIFRLHLIKHALINISMYVKHWGNKSFLHPFYCRIFFSFQRNFLIRLINY